MLGTSRPVIVDQTSSCGRWNSMCPLGGDDVLAVSDVNGTIFLARGKVTGQL